MPGPPAGSQWMPGTKEGLKCLWLYLLFVGVCYPGVGMGQWSVRIRKHLLNVRLCCGAGNHTKQVTPTRVVQTLGRSEGHLSL